MLGNDYPIEYFDLMANVVRYLASIQIQLLRCEYHYESFGSWWFTFQKKGTEYRVVYDGRDFEFRFESDPRPEKIHGVFTTQWKEVIVRSAGDSRGAALQPLIVDLIQQGLAESGVI